MPQPSKPRRWQERLSSITISTSLLALVLVVGGGYIAFLRYQASHTISKTSEESLIVPAIDPSDHTLGPLNAPVQVIAYADLSCVYCNDFFLNTLPKLRAQFGGQFVLAYRHLPLADHPNSEQEGNAAECVANLGGTAAFWKYVQAIFTQPDYLSGLNLSRLASIADQIGISGDKVTQCVEAGTTKPIIGREALQASVAGIGSTPSFVVKSATRALVVQSDSFSQLKTAIQYMLATSTSGGY